MTFPPRRFFCKFLRTRKKKYISDENSMDDTVKVNQFIRFFNVVVKKASFLYKFPKELEILTFFETPEANQYIYMVFYVYLKQLIRSYRLVY